MDASETETEKLAEPAEVEPQEPAGTESRPLEFERARRLAERAVLVPVGAALVARERLLQLLQTPAAAEAQLREFEQRGKIARDHLEDRLRVPRELLAREVESHTTCLRNEVRNTMRDLASKGDRVASKLRAHASTSP